MHGDNHLLPGSSKGSGRGDTWPADCASCPVARAGRRVVDELALGDELCAPRGRLRAAIVGNAALCADPRSAQDEGLPAAHRGCPTPRGSRGRPGRIRIASNCLQARTLNCADHTVAAQSFSMGKADCKGLRGRPRWNPASKARRRVSVDLCKLRPLAGCATYLAIDQRVTAPRSFSTRPPSPARVGALQVPYELVAAATVVTVTHALTLAAAP